MLHPGNLLFDIFEDEIHFVGADFSASLILETSLQNLLQVVATLILDNTETRQISGGGGSLLLVNY